MKWFQHMFNMFSGRYIQIIDEANTELYNKAVELRKRTIDGDPGWMLEKNKKRFDCDCKEV